MATGKKRKEIEQLIYETYDKLDPQHYNSDYYKAIFAQMDDKAFYKFLSKRLPFRFHEDTFKVEPNMHQIIDGFKVIGAPLFESVKLPYIYKDKDGNPIESLPCLVGYIHLKRMKQMLSKKNSTASNISDRDMRTGRLLNKDKGGQESDKEFETLGVFGLNATMTEFAKVRADSMRSKEEVYNLIQTKGFVHADEVQITPDDSLSKNMMNAYLIGANLMSNLIMDKDTLMLPITAKRKQDRIIQRQTNTI